MTQHAFRTGKTPALSIAAEAKDYPCLASPHDLEALLCHAREFTQILLDLREKLTGKEQEYAGFLETSLQHIESMQEALCFYLYTSSQSLQISQVDCNAIAQRVITEIKNIYPLKIIFECGNLPAIFADPSHVHTLLFSLIDNAVKFHAPEALQRHVSITGISQDELALIEIRDKGIGIADADIENAFCLFRRLHPDKYPGAGTGLAIARNIARRYGGDLFITSEPDNGTSVMLVLPYDLQ